jgi:hypothetical protein
MIVKDHEKKACGFISVTRITVRTHVSALPSYRGGAATVDTGRPPQSYGRPAPAVARVPLAAVEDAGRGHRGANDA